jgi:hypothetical protein
MSHYYNRRGLLAAAALIFCAAAGAVTAEKAYEVHDMSRPFPAKVEPGAPSTQDKVGTAPSDAIVLFDGKDLSKWKNANDGAAPNWDVRNGYMQVRPGTTSIVTREDFGDCQLHVEWQSPAGVPADRDGFRANSGVFLMNLYEVQVIDTFQKPSYPDGLAGSIYGQYPPLVNPALPAGRWQTYDIVFRRPHFKDGKLERPATFTILFNGVLVQDHVPSIGPTQHGKLAHYTPDHPDKGPIQLQNHGDPVRYRNIWIRPLPDETDMPKPPVRAAGHH